MKEFLNLFIAFSCKRVNTQSGSVQDLGIYPPGEFVDAGNKTKGVNPPTAGIKYYYIVEMILRDINQMIEETKSVASAQASKKGGQQPIPYAMREAKNHKISTAAKHLSPTALSKGLIAYGSALVSHTSGQTIDSNQSGVQRIISISSPKPEVGIINANVSFSGNYPIITWGVLGHARMIDHFIINCSQSGYSHPCGVAHHLPSAGSKFKFVDTTQTIPGKVSYSIVPVYTDYSMGKAAQAGAVVIQN